MVNNVILNRLELLKARILRTPYLTPSDFLTTYKFRLEVSKELVKKWKLAYYLS
jgi:hypothetical protein